LSLKNVLAANNLAENIFVKYDGKKDLSARTVTIWNIGKGETDNINASIVDTGFLLQQELSFKIRAYRCNCGFGLCGK
jgi:hypothetical protein